MCKYTIKVTNSLTTIRTLQYSVQNKWKCTGMKMEEEKEPQNEL
mgnify:CR=1 FL=1